MITVYSLEEIPPLASPIALTFGMFDGVHLGHRQILQELKKHGTAVVLTFSNHPSEVLRNHKPQQLCSLEQKLERFENLGIDCTVVVKFTREFANQPYDLFLRNLKKHIPFTTLIRGKGDAFGHNRTGDESHVKLLQDDLSFTAIYLEKETIDGQIVSSKRIRELILAGQHEQASALLGHEVIL